MLHPRHAVQLLKRLRKEDRATKAADDAQLRLYAEVLGGDFLNYGYFYTPDIPPEKLSLHDIQQAQLRYGQLLIDQIRDRDGPVLDAGCGMGGLLNLLVAQGYSPTALTPNRSQIHYVQSKHPAVPLVQVRFEQIPLEKYRRHFSTVITSESLQYMKLSEALAMLEQILAPGGRWILCDYFRTCESTRKSGHRWDDFTRALQEGKWKVVSERDITRHTLPSVGYVYMWGRRVAVPVAGFVLARLQRKRPALHYLLEEVIDEIQKYLLDHLDLVNPEIFAREKKYMLLVVERGA